MKFWKQYSFISKLKATHLTKAHWSCAVVLLLSLSYTSIILVVARRCLVIMYLVLKTGGAILGSLFLHMNFVLKLATLTSTDMILASFHTQEIFGILYLLLFLLLLTIYLTLNVGYIGTLEALTESFLCIIFWFVLCMSVSLILNYAIGPCFSLL